MEGFLPQANLPARSPILPEIMFLDYKRGGMKTAKYPSIAPSPDKNPMPSLPLK